MTTTRDIMFDVFNENDFAAFAGVESNQPLIHYSEDGHAVIIDANTVIVTLILNDDDVIEYRAEHPDDAYEFALFMARVLKYTPKRRLHSVVQSMFVS